MWWIRLANEHIKDYLRIHPDRAQLHELDIGVTSNLEAQGWQHKTKAARGFTSRYQTELLVFYELMTTLRLRALEPKQLKGWPRARKNALVESMNPRWYDLSGAKSPAASPDPSLRSG